MASWSQALRLRFGLEGDKQPVQVSALTSFRRTTIVLAHMDDEINATGLLSRLRQAGSELDIVVLTDGAANPWTDERVLAGRTHFECRRDELFEAMRVLEISASTLPAYPDSALEQHLAEATALLTQHFAARAPQLVLTFEPSGLNGHRDHIAAHVATRRALVESGVNSALAFITPPPPFSYVLGSGFRSPALAQFRTLTLTPDEHQRKAHLADTVYASQARTLKLLTGGLSAHSFFRLFAKEWYLWLDAPAAVEWALLTDAHLASRPDLVAAARRVGGEG